MIEIKTLTTLVIDQSLFKQIILTCCLDTLITGDLSLGKGGKAYQQ
jgi:hypothetical protein